MCTNVANNNILENYACVKLVISMKMEIWHFRGIRYNTNQKAYLRIQTFQLQQPNQIEKSNIHTQGY